MRNTALKKLDGKSCPHVSNQALYTRQTVSLDSMQQVLKLLVSNNERLASVKDKWCMSAKVLLLTNMTFKLRTRRKIFCWKFSRRLFLRLMNSKFGKSLKAELKTVFKTLLFSFIIFRLRMERKHSVRSIERSLKLQSRNLRLCLSLNSAQISWILDLIRAMTSTFTKWFLTTTSSDIEEFKIETTWYGKVKVSSLE